MLDQEFILSVSKLALCTVYIYTIVIIDCPIAVGAESPHKFLMCRQPRNVIQTSIVRFRKERNCVINL
jgi:hypothetical protein